MTKEFIKKLKKSKKNEEYECYANPTIEDCYKLYERYKLTFEKSTYGASHFLIEGTFLKDTIVIKKEISIS